MADTSPERSYKHQVRSSLIIEALTTPNWTDQQSERFNLNGISKVKGEYLNKIANLDKKFKEEIAYIYLYDIEIIDNESKVIIEDYNQSDLSIVFYKCKLSLIRFSKCNLKVLAQNEITKIQSDIYFYESDLDSLDFIVSAFYNFNFIKSKIKYITFFFSNFCDFHSIESSIDSILLKNSQADNFYIKKSSVGDFSVIDESVIGKVKVWGESEMKYLQTNSSISRAFCFSDKSVIDDFDITNCLTEEINIDSCELRSINVKDSKIGDFTVYDSSCDNLEIQKNNQTGNFSVANSHFLEWDIDNVFASFQFISTNIALCRLENCKIPELRLEGSCEIELYISGGTDGTSFINNIDFDQLTLGKSCVVSFSDTWVYACHMNEFSMLGNLYFRNIKRAENVFVWLEVESFLAQKFTPDEIEKKVDKYQKTEKLLLEQKDKYTKHTLELLQIFEKSTFCISQSSLGKTEFTECDLAGFNFEFNNSKITEVFISGGTVPDDVVVYDEMNPVKALEQKKSFFDQLKKVFEGQGDIVRGTKYHAKTSEIQMQIIEASKKRWWFKYFDTEWWVYKLNETSNRHGESWGWAIVFTLGVSSIGFIFYNAALESVKYELVLGWHTDFIGDWAQFILPTHKTDFMVKEPSSHALFIDVVSRMFIGYGIYQLISAFRKHGKRG